MTMKCEKMLGELLDRLLSRRKKERRIVMEVEWSACGSKAQLDSPLPPSQRGKRKATREQSPARGRSSPNWTQAPRQAPRPVGLPPGEARSVCGSKAQRGIRVSPAGTQAFRQAPRPVGLPPLEGGRGEFPNPGRQTNFASVQEQPPEKKQQKPQNPNPL